MRFYKEKGASQRRYGHEKRTSARWLARSRSVTDETRGRRKGTKKRKERGELLKEPSRAQGKEGDSTFLLPRRAGSLYTKRQLYYDARGSEKGEA